MIRRYFGQLKMVLFKCAILSTALLCLSCVTPSSNYTTRDFIVVETTGQDSLESLAKTYLHDGKKAWLISEFNKIKEIRPGQRVIIPLKPFNKGGLTPEGIQMVPVLCFGLSDSGSDQGKKGSGCSPRDSFTAFLGYLKNHNYHVISMEQMMEFLAYKGQVPEKSVVITFDDQSLAMIEWVLPSLASFGYPATVFLNVRGVGQQNSMAFEDIRPYLSKGIRLGSRAGWVVDSDIEQKQSGIRDFFESMEKEIAYSKTVIEKETGKPCRFYAYPPSGPYNLIIHLLKKYGFIGGFTMMGESNPFYAEHYSIHRIHVPLDCSTDSMERKLLVFKTMELR